MNRTPWENELWSVEPFWLGQTVYMAASGPSMTQDVADRLRGQKVMVINSTAKIMPWADIWFFTDNNVFDDNRNMVANWPGVIITASKEAKRQMPLKVKRVQLIWGPAFREGKDGHIRQGRSSGHTAISVAIALGAKRIVLCGYDMRLVDGQEHHHHDYAGKPRDLDIYEREFIPAFRGWNEEALAQGVQILNATPGSALKEFPMVNLEDVLSERIAA